MLKNSVELTGVFSGNGEEACIDVTKEEFVRIIGLEPDEFDKSGYYKNLYQIYGLDIRMLLPKDRKYNDNYHMKINVEFEKVGEAESLYE